MWNELLSIDGIHIVNIEIKFSNESQHRAHVDNRYKTNKNKYPSWQDVIERDYDICDSGITTIDKSLDDTFKELLEKLNLVS